MQAALKEITIFFEGSNIINTIREDWESFWMAGGTVFGKFNELPEGRWEIINRSVAYNGENDKNNMKIRGKAEQLPSAMRFLDRKQGQLESMRRSIEVQAFHLHSTRDLSWFLPFSPVLLVNFPSFLKLYYSATPLFSKFRLHKTAASTSKYCFKLFFNFETYRSHLHSHYVFSCFLLL